MQLSFLVLIKDKIFLCYDKEIKLFFHFRVKCAYSCWIELFFSSSYFCLQSHYFYHYLNIKEFIKSSWSTEMKAHHSWIRAVFKLWTDFFSFVLNVHQFAFLGNCHMWIQCAYIFLFIFHNVFIFMGMFP